MNQKNNEVFEVDILRLLKAMWQRVWAIILAAVLCGGIGFAYASYGITPLYEASALIYVNTGSISLGSTSVSITSGDLNLAKNLVDTYLVILKTRLTLEEVIKQADLPYSYEALSGMISAGAVNSTEIFRVTVTSSNPYEAAEIANTITKVLPEKISDIVNGSSVRTVDYAVVPSGKSSPNITRYTSMGLLIGALISCGVIAVLELLDDQIHDSDYLTSAFDIPVLSEIPELTESGKGYGYKSYGKKKGYYKYAYYKQKYTYEE